MAHVEVQSAFSVPMGRASPRDRDVGAIIARRGVGVDKRAPLGRALLKAGRFKRRVLRLRRGRLAKGEPETVGLARRGMVTGVSTVSPPATAQSRRTLPRSREAGRGRLWICGLQQAVRPSVPAWLVLCTHPSHSDCCPRTLEMPALAQALHYAIYTTQGALTGRKSRRNLVSSPAAAPCLFRRTPAQQRGRGAGAPRCPASSSCTQGAPGAARTMDRGRRPAAHAAAGPRCGLGSQVKAAGPALGPLHAAVLTCVGTLQLLMQIEAHPASSRYRQRSTRTPMPEPT
jgi:hypothetical protein